MLLIFFLFIQPISSNEIRKFTVEEKSPINTFIADLSDELSITTSARYFLAELLPMHRNLFAMNNQTGHLTTATRNLDRDAMCFNRHCSCQSCEIALQLIIHTEGRILSRMIEIRIQDRNDHSPVFDQQSIGHLIHIKENVPLGYRVVLPTASDPDEGLNSIQSYRLDGMNANDFDLDCSSIEMPYLIIRSTLDRRRISSYSLTLIASDHGQPSKARIGSIEIQIRIINESIPIFLQSVYHVDIREDTIVGTSVLKIEAMSDENRKIYYELITDSPFTIDRLTGNVQLKKLLDYEREKSYRLIIKAYENSIPSYAVIFVHVIDINDNPVLIHINTEGNATVKQRRDNQQVLLIPENTSVGTILGHVILNDLDSFANGNPYLQLTTIEPPLPLIYKLIYQNNFQNTKVYSLILHANLDRESKSTYKNLQLLAFDSGTPTLQTRLDMLLNVTDINDCIPRIRTNSTIYHINENNPIGLILDTLIGYDCDIESNGEFEYSIVNQTDVLIIDPRTGQMSLNRSIDFEKLNHSKVFPTVDLDFLVQIKDHGQPPLSSQTKMTLRIHDLNDHAPVFDPNQSFNWTFPRSILHSGSVLGRILAYDNDSGLQGVVHYSINSFDSCLILDITSLGYMHLLAHSSCSLESHTFEIIASDYGTPNSRSTKQILMIHLDSNEFRRNSLPQLLPFSTQRTIVDVNSLGNVAFILDITNNRSLQPNVILNKTDLSTCWNISSTGEVRLIGQPYALSYILSLNIVDEYTQENGMHKLQIDICNSSIRNACNRMMLNEGDRKENEVLLLWTICLALFLTFLCVFVFSLLTCLCCRKQRKGKKLVTNFMQCNDDFQSEKTFKSSLGSTIRDDDRDSACVINTNTSSLSSSTIPIRSKSFNTPNYQSSTYFYDIKLAELMRNNQHPPCVYLTSQSFSTDYGFASCEASPSSTSCSSMKLNPSNILSSDWNTEMNVDRSSQRQINTNRFVSTHECVV